MSTTESFLPALEAVLVSRKAEQPEGSYSATLVTDSVKVRRKIMEEAFEVCVELESPEVDTALAAEEAADLVFHLLAGLVGAGVPWQAVEDVLRARHQPN